MLLGMSETKAVFLLSVLGISSGISRLLVGWVADSPSIDSVALYTLALLVAGASTCSLPSLRSYQLLCGYEIVYGICCGNLDNILSAFWGCGEAIERVDPLCFLVGCGEWRLHQASVVLHFLP